MTTIRLLSTYLRRPALLAATIPLLLMSSCDIGEDKDACEYKTRLIYRYDGGSSTGDNLLSQYVQSISEYIFDENDRLTAVNTLPSNSSFGAFVSETNLPVGKYSVIAWGNKATPSQVNKAEIGVTTRTQMELYLNNPYSEATDESCQQACERLFYGYHAFSVEKYGISKVHVDLMHSHCVLTISVKWKNDVDVPEDTGDFYMLVKGVPSRKSFMPDYVFNGHGAESHNPKQDAYPKDCADRQTYIPVVYGDDDLAQHRVDASMSTGKRLTGQFITYRYRNSSHPLLSIHTKDKQIMKEIDLQKFFKEMAIELDTNTRQEFEIEIEIEEGGTKVSVGIVNVGDWDEGGVVGR